MNSEFSPAQTNAFYFALLSFGRLGTWMLHTALNRHPGLYVPYFNTTDRLISEAKHSSLATDQAPCPIFPRWPGIQRYGLMLHAINNFNRQTPSAMTYVHGAKIIQVVRDPLKHMLSRFNNYIAWLFVNAGTPMVQGLPVPESIESYIQQNILFYRYYELGIAFAQYRKEWKVIDFAELIGNKLRDSLNDLFLSIGVSPDDYQYDENLEKSTKGIWILRTLNLELDVYGFPLPIIVRYDGYPWPDEERYQIEVAKIASLGQFLPDHLDDRPGVALASPQHWYTIPQKIREYLITHKQIENLVSQNILPPWSQKMQKQLSLAARHQIRELTEDQRDKLYALIRDDLNNLKREFPEQTEHWDI